MLICLPTTIQLVRHVFAILKAPTVHCPCNPCNTKLKTFFRQRRSKFAKPRFCLKIALLLGGWLSISQLSYGIYSSVQHVRVWDPFHILGVSVFSSSAVIKQRYKRKSLQFHPDKRPRWMTKEEAEAKFIDLTKAYKAYSRT